MLRRSVAFIERWLVDEIHGMLNGQHDVVMDGPRVIRLHGIIRDHQIFRSAVRCRAVATVELPPEVGRDQNECEANEKKSNQEDDAR